MSDDSVYSAPRPVAQELCFTSVRDPGHPQASCMPPGAHVFPRVRAGSLFPCAWGCLAGQLSVSPSERRALEAGMFAACLPPASLTICLTKAGSSKASALLPMFLVSTCRKDLGNRYLVPSCGKFPGFLNFHVNPQSPIKNLLTF